MSFLELEATAPIKPTKYRLEFKNGQFQYWDKEKEERVSVELPLKFTVIYDKSFCIAGWSASDDNGFYSNVAMNWDTELVVRTKNGEQFRGVWADIKDSLKADGGKYAKNVFAVAEINGKNEFVELVITGATGTAYKSTEDIDTKRYQISVNETEQRKRGGQKFSVPVFVQGDEIEGDALNAAVEASGQLKAWNDEMKKYVSNLKEQEPVEPRRPTQIDDAAEVFGSEMPKSKDKKIAEAVDNIPKIDHKPSVTPEDVPF